MFITIEGLSGSGKTTVATLLAERLGAYYYKTPASMFVPIRSTVDAMATPFARYLYYYAGIVQASAEIVEALSQRPVVCDKFVATMLAYSRAAGVEVSTPSPEVIRAPDVSFLLEVQETVRMTRLNARGPITPEHASFLAMEQTCNVIMQYRQLNLVAVDNSEADVKASVGYILRHLANHGLLNR